MSSKLTKQDYIEYIKLELTAGVLELEIEDKIIGKFVDDSLIEMRRYYDQANFVTVPFAKEIDLKGFNYSSILNVYRSQSLIGDTITGEDASSAIDPMYAQQWMVFAQGGYTYNLQNYVLNYLSYNALLQMENTTSTDMSFIEDKKAEKLYINCYMNLPKSVTIEYVPVLTDVEQITDDYWIDNLKKMSLAKVKIALGRVRTRFTQSNALWTQDGETLLAEGNEELKDLREKLRVSDDIFLIRD